MTGNAQGTNWVQVALVVVVVPGVTYLTTHSIESTLRALFVSTFVTLAWLLWPRRKPGE